MEENKVLAVATEEEVEQLKKLDTRNRAISETIENLVDQRTALIAKKLKLWKEINGKYQLNGMPVNINHETREITEIKK